jgi:hypothetical protein
MNVTGSSSLSSKSFEGMKSPPDGQQDIGEGKKGVSELREEGRKEGRKVGR